jgi:type VII secretion-associated serine protease mycosin
MRATSFLVLGLAALALPVAAEAAGPDSAASATKLAVAQAYLTAIRAPQAWQTAASCKSAVVAVVDSGVDGQNPALRGSVLPGWNVLTENSDTADTAGHGTMVAGLIAARPERGLAAAGVCRNARILPVVVWSATQKPTAATIAAGINWAADHGASVINLSLGGSSPNNAIRHAIDAALAKNIVVVAAAGNAFTDAAQYPAAYPGVLAVSATDAQGTRPAFSSYGPWVGVAAPGTGMRSTQGTGVAVGDGTSFAAPLVSATAALLRTEHPDWSETRVVQQIEQTADDAGPFGTDPSFGHGILDIAAAVGAAAPQRLALGPVDRYEPNDLPSEAHPIPVGTRIAATFAPENDVDWYSVDVKAPTELILTGAPAAADVSNLLTQTSLVVAAYGPTLDELATRDARWDGTRGGLTVAVPAVAPGRYYFELSNAYGSRGAYSLRIARGKLDGWAAWQESYTGSEANAVATGDLNGDGRTDVLLASSRYFSPVYANQLVLFTQQRDGTLSTPQILPRASKLCCGDVAIGDLNGDGALDAVATLGVDGLETFVQHDGKLGLPTVVHTASAAENVAFLGRDLVVGEASGLHVLRPNGSGYADTLVDSTSPLAVRVADLNGDRRPDIVATEAQGTGLAVYLQQADGRFVRKQVAVPKSASGPLAVGDLNGDGRPDIAVSVAGGVEVLYGQAGGGFASAHFLSAPAAPLAIADLNGDGRPDLAVGNTVFLQESDGRLAAGQADGSTQHGFGADTLAAADLNGDGRTDLVWAGGYGLVVVPRLGSWTGPSVWVDAATPAPNAERVPVSSAPTVRFARTLDPASVTTKTVQLLDEHGNRVAAAVSYDASSRTVTLQPASLLAKNTSYEVTVGGVKDAAGDLLAVPFTDGFFTGSPAAAALYPA